MVLSAETLSPAERYMASLTGDGRYRLLVESITDYAIYMLSSEGHVSSWNAGAQRVKGYRSDEIIGQHFSTFYTGEDRATDLPARALSLATETGRFENEGWRVRKDGTRFWAHVVIDAIRAPGGDLVGFAKITRDLTERRASEEALRASQEQFRLLVQGVTDYALYMLSPEGQISSWNPGAARIKGYSAEEAVGSHFSCFYTAEDRAAGAPAKALSIAAAEGRFENEARRVRKDGTEFWAHVVIDAVRAPTGDLLGFAKITRDITAQRDAQKALEVARQSLFESQKMDAIGQLTGGVAHDFNNLLMVIQGSLGLLRKRLDADERSLQLLDNALQGARRGSALTQRMLAFARRQEMAVAPVDLRELVAGMTDLLTRSLDAGIELETRFALQLPCALADPHQLELALLNLVVNARDAMPGGGRIIVAAHEPPAMERPADLAPARYVRLSVADSGDGMDAATLARATEPFFTTKGIGKGTGLGLPMVHGVAQQSGGRLILKSTPGQGTTAEIWLRVGESVAVTSVPVPVRLESIRPLSILVVDDDALVLQSTAAMLEDLGHRVTQSASGAAALRTLEDGRDFDLLITDQAMPQMSGAELSVHVHRRWADLPIVLMSAYAELPVKLGAGLTRLPKPFTQEALQTALQQATAAH